MSMKVGSVDSQALVSGNGRPRHPRIPAKRRDEGTAHSGGRSIILHPDQDEAQIDKTMVSFPFYNAFNYSLLAKDNPNVRLTIGITSANPGEGKTLVAANLAVSLAMAYRRKTILIDFNLQAPRLHEVFGAPLSPGFFEALNHTSIYVASTPFEHLFVLSGGDCSGGCDAPRSQRRQGSAEPVVGLDKLDDFLQVLSSLEREFQFVIMDMPSINTQDFPILFAGQLNGVVVVVDTSVTRRQDIDKMFLHLNEQQVLGFVYNRIRNGFS